MAEELREIMASLGMRTVNELIGRTDMLEMNAGSIPWKAKRIDFSRILYQPRRPLWPNAVLFSAAGTLIKDVLDRKLISLAQPALEHKQPVCETLAIRNSDRTTGAMLSGELVKQRGEAGLPDDTIRFHFIGVAGQSFGAWLAKGITLELEGLANDYVGKGMSGGRIIIYPDKKATYIPEENILIGNTTFYGAIAGRSVYPRPGRRALLHPQFRGVRGCRGRG